jgi:ferredoxin-type protein NapH
MKKRQKIRTGMILSTFFLLPALFFYMSPYLIIEATAQGIINGSFFTFGLMFFSSLFLGRAYCGWVCPAAGCQEAISPVREKRVHGGNWIKWILWIPWFSTIVFLAISNHGYRKVEFLYQTTYGLSIGNVYSLILYFLVLLLIVLPAFIIGKRSFCHHLCWMAPYMIIGRKIRNLFHWTSLNLVADRDQCIHCHTCTRNCPMSLPVETMVESGSMENTECILCGSCIDGCQSHVIRYGFRMNASAAERRVKN